MSTQDTRLARLQRLRKRMIEEITRFLNEHLEDRAVEYPRNREQTDSELAGLTPAESNHRPRD